VGGRRGEAGRRENFWGEKRLRKLTTLGREDVFLVHPQNNFNDLILN
jgi:hypothetical protein